VRYRARKVKSVDVRVVEVAGDVVGLEGRLLSEYVDARDAWAYLWPSMLNALRKSNLCGCDCDGDGGQNGRIVSIVGCVTPPHLPGSIAAGRLVSQGR
jgi:hypothetical protein